MQSEELSPHELSALLSSYMPDIPGYRVIRRIGRGGMSYVYLGVQVSLDRQVAIKVMSPEALVDEKSKQRFEQEAHTIAKLEHPSIVGIHEVGRTPQGLLYYVLPYLAKGHLGQRDFTNDEPRIVEVLRALLSALDYAHTRGIVHRDVKAENVLFDNADRPLLTDFGIALSKRDSTRITTAGLAVGSGGYMSPEQARGETVDGRADLYSVGVLAYELLCSRLPYLSSDALGLALMHAQDPIPRLGPEKKHWQPFIDRAMAKSPENRFRNAQQMLDALAHVQIKAATTLGATPAKIEAPTAPSRTGLKIALAGAALVTVIAASMLMFKPNKKPDISKSDFFTTKDGLATSTTAATVPAPVPDLVAAAPAPIATDTTPIATDAAGEPVPVAEADAGAATFANVAAAVTVTTLGYDPAIPGARELSAVHRQIRQNKISSPSGDNAIESLLALRKLEPENTELALLSDDIVSRLEAILSDAIVAGKDDNARTIYQRAQKFARDSGLAEGSAWAKLRSDLPPLLVARLEKAARASDSALFDRTKTLALTLDVPQHALEPAWSRSVQTERPTEIAHSNGPTMVQVMARSATSPGLAFMRDEVTRVDYADFVTATQRPITRCRNRNAAIAFKKRTWVDPGFAQTGNHPVVCVSYNDAVAYAQWLSQRSGDTYRLPSFNEWKLIANYRGSGDACKDGRLDCGQPVGTVAANQGPSSPMGINGARGNAREWLTDCAGSCQRHMVGGVSWRDKPARADPLDSTALDANSGFDDVGFRLLKERP